MHSKNPNTVVVICQRDNKKPFREFNVNSSLHSRGSDVYVPFDTEYSFLIRNNDHRRVKVEITIDGMDIGGGIVIEANSSHYIERFVSVQSRFKFVSVDNPDVCDPTSHHNGRIVVHVVAENDTIPRTPSYTWEPMFYTNNVTTYGATVSSNVGATVEGSVSNQKFDTTHWLGDSNDVFRFDFHMKAPQQHFSNKQLDEIKLLKKLQLKYKEIDLSEI